MIFRSITRSVSLAAAMSLLPSAFAESVSVQQLQMEKEAVELIGQLEEVARDVQYNSERLHFLGREMKLSKWTHVHHLNQIRELVNDGLRPALTRLTEIQPNLPDWKQKSIDQMLNVAKALAADANSAIMAKNQNSQVPPAINAEYREMIARVSGHAQDLVKTSEAAGTYAAARQKAAEAGVNVPKH